MEELVFFNRDLSWLSFNERVLLQAAKDELPLLERIKFLSIYSSNLDEFYRVRIPVLMAVDEHQEVAGVPGNYELARAEIGRQQELFGQIIHKQILPALSACGIHWVYNEKFPESIAGQASHLFFTEILAYIHTVNIDDDLTHFFAENNKLYQAIILMDKHGHERLELVNVPSDVLPRFYAITNPEGSYVVFLEDIMKQNMAYFFPEDEIKGVFNLKITRDAELNPENSRDEEDITAALEHQLESRDLGFATRFLYEPGIPLRNLYRLIYGLNLQKASVVAGGRYHNLKDLNDFPLKGAEYVYPKWPAVHFNISRTETLFSLILKKDILINVPYQSYDPVLRFFNEAANDVYVREIYATLYRVAERSRIVSALMTAARNGKKVVVMVELKARFDEANNIKWAKQMKAAGVKIIYSNLDLKVHAKIALVKRMVLGNDQSVSLLATGNLNENTARFYTDQILLTAHQPMLKELEL
jgi:polyphosphate kinase